MSDSPPLSESTTFWLRPDGQVATHRVWFDENGVQCGEAGEPAPPGTELDQEGVARAMRAQVKAAGVTHKAHQAEAKKIVRASVLERTAKVKEMTDAGLPLVAAEAIVGPEPVFEPVAFQPDPAASAGLLSYGLTSEQSARILTGWV